MSGIPSELIDKARYGRRNSSTQIREPQQVGAIYNINQTSNVRGSTLLIRLCWSDRMIIRYILTLGPKVVGLCPFRWKFAEVVHPSCSSSSTILPSPGVTSHGTTGSLQLSTHVLIITSLSKAGGS